MQQSDLHPAKSLTQAVTRNVFAGMKAAASLYMTDSHIKTIRLFDLALRANLPLADWEKDHLNSCEECQGVLAVFARQAKQTPTPATPIRVAPRFNKGDEVKITVPGPLTGKVGTVVDVVQPKAGDYVYRYRVSFPAGNIETLFGFEMEAHIIDADTA